MTPRSARPPTGSSGCETVSSSARYCRWRRDSRTQRTPRKDTTMTATDLFPRTTRGLPFVERPTLHRLRDGDRLALEIAPVVKDIGRAPVRMIAYNGSIPGPTLHVDQGSEIIVDVTNNGDVETTVHWHGLRLDNRQEGVPGHPPAPLRTD